MKKTIKLAIHKYLDTYLANASAKEIYAHIPTIMLIFGVSRNIAKTVIFNYFGNINSVEMLLNRIEDEIESTDTIIYDLNKVI